MQSIGPQEIINWIELQCTNQQREVDKLQSLQDEASPFIKDIYTKSLMEEQIVLQTLIRVKKSIIRFSETKAV